jgi:hypothetical protein
MTSKMPRTARSRFGAIALFCASIVTSACHDRSSPSAPIEFSIIPPAAGGGPNTLAPIAGRVANAEPGDAIVLFAKSNVWWVQPFRSRPFTKIDENRSWKTSTHLGTEYAALLVRSGYRPPATIQELPSLGGDIVAIATVKGVGTYAPPARKTVTFSGYEWEVRQTPTNRGGQNEFDGRNVWTDSDGRLHLALVQRDGQWTSAEAIITRALGYGTYVFVVRDADQLDPAAALGMLTWDDTAPDQNHRELDIEISRWGDPGSKNAQYAVQPQYIAANVARFEAPAGVLTHTLRWEPGRALFTTVRGAGVEAGPRVFEHEFTSGVPTPGNELFRMNLVYFRKSKQPPRKDVEVVIDRFIYLP